MRDPGYTRMFKDHVFQNGTVRLDGQTFERCTLDECIIEYGASDPFVFIDVTFKDCKWGFVDAADGTIQSWRMLYSVLGLEGVVEEVFEHICSKEHGRRRRPTKWWEWDLASLPADRSVDGAHAALCCPAENERHSCSGSLSFSYHRQHECLLRASKKREDLCIQTAETLQVEWSGLRAVSKRIQQCE